MTTTASSAERRWRLAEGDEIAPGLHALDRLGGGHRYEAYLAFDDRLHSIVVAKVVRPHLVDDEHTLDGLRGEAEMLSRLAHPGDRALVRRDDRRRAPARRPRAHRGAAALDPDPPPRAAAPEQLVPLALQLCAALHYLSEERVVHLDVKPANVIMAGPPRLIDLSVAMDLDAASGLDHPIGTDGYMAPGAVRPGRRSVRPGTAADVFGLGVTLYRAASGARPFESGR